MRFPLRCLPLLLSVPLAGAESWNVRIEPSLDGEIVATAAADASAPVREKTGDWHGIDLPENAPVWVASVFLNSDGSLKESARLRIITAVRKFRRMLRFWNEYMTARGSGLLRSAVCADMCTAVFSANPPLPPLPPLPPRPPHR